MAGTRLESFFLQFLPVPSVSLHINDDVVLTFIASTEHNSVSRVELVNKGYSFFSFLFLTKDILDYHWNAWNMASYSHVLTARCFTSGLCPTNVGIPLHSISHNSIQKGKKQARHNYNSTWGIFLTGGNSHFDKVSLRTKSSAWSFTHLTKQFSRISPWLYLLHLASPPRVTHLRCQAPEVCVYAGGLHLCCRETRWAGRAQPQWAWMPFRHQMASSNDAQRGWHSP